METLYQHQLRPRIYFETGNGWHTDRWFDQRIKKENITTLN